MVNRTLPDNGPRAPGIRFALANGGGAAAETNCVPPRITSDETSVDNILQIQILSEIRYIEYNFRCACVKLLVNDFKGRRDGGPRGVARQRLPAARRRAIADINLS